MAKNASKSTKTNLEKKVYKALKKVMDPELDISILDLGLIYNVSVKNDESVTITMTLTTMGCPLMDVIEESVVAEVSKIPEVKSAKVELTFDPPWNPDKMTNEAKSKLGFF